MFRVWTLTKSHGWYLCWRGTGGVMNLNRLGPDFIILINFQVIKKCGAGAEKLATFGQFR